MFKKADYVLIISLVAVSILTFFIILDKKDILGESVIIKLNGETIEKVSLVQNKTIKIEKDNIFCIITIKNRSVFMEQSNCKDSYCMKQGSINRTNQSIVCLPNKVIIQIEGGNNEIDVYVKNTEGHNG